MCERNSGPRSRSPKPLLGAALSALVLASCGPRPASFAVLNEVSGVTLHNGALYIVDDSIQGAYFRVSLGQPTIGRPIPLNSLHPEKVPLREVGPWVDLEAIDCLADGRIAVLSERIRGLIGDNGLIAEYDYPLSEFGRRGLEGLAVRRLPNRSSRIAVLWEGGYPDVGSLHPQLQQTVGLKPLLPLIFVHDLAPGAVLGRVRWESGLLRITLHPPVPEGAEPEAQRFRAPDLVWYRWPHAPGEPWGFLVLLSSQNSVQPQRFLHHWLQRFDLAGQPVGEPLNIADYVPARLGAANWEGLCWYQEGRSLILVHEGSPRRPPNAFILELPPAWRYSASP